MKTQDSQDSSVGIDAFCGLDGHILQTGSGVHPASYSRSNGGSFPGVDWPSAEVRNGGAIPPLPHMASWCSAYLIKVRDNLQKKNTVSHIFH
jgi:hypothetical protein